MRDGPNAGAFSKQVIRLIGERNPGILSHLAAAHAEAGDFEKAVAIQKQAVPLVSGSASQAPYAAALRLYESGRPFRDDSW